MRARSSSSTEKSKSFNLDSSNFSPSISRQPQPRFWLLFGGPTTRTNDVAAAPVAIHAACAYHHSSLQPAALAPARTSDEPFPTRSASDDHESIATGRSDTCLRRLFLFPRAVTISSPLPHPNTPRSPPTPPATRLSNDATSSPRARTVPPPRPPLPTRLSQINAVCASPQFDRVGTFCVAPSEIRPRCYRAQPLARIETGATAQAIERRGEES